MLELLDPVDIDPYAYGSHEGQIPTLLERLIGDSPKDESKGELAKIRQYSLLEKKRIGWNYCMDYSWMAMKLDGLHGKVLDIGAGPGAIHKYLEEKYSVDIVGIDMMRWDKDYIDYVGNFNDEEFRRTRGFLPNTYDFIISTSAFEHNSPDEHKLLVKNCMQVLKSGGILLTTLATSHMPGFCEAGNQWNLDRSELEDVYQCKFSQFDYNGVLERWNSHPNINIAYKQWRRLVKKHKRVSLKDLGKGIPYVSVGAKIIK